MINKTCELCGEKIESRDINKYYVVPLEVRGQIGIKRAKSVRLCSKCKQELNRWNLTKIAEECYDIKMKRFRIKSPVEMVKEYEYAYKMFEHYKKGL
jgi:hypothetical protein